MIDDRSTSDRQGFVVDATSTDEIWDESLNVVAIQLQETAWDYYRTSPRPLTDLKPAGIIFHARAGQTVIVIYPALIHSFLSLWSSLAVIPLSAL